jgi:hypothetical protein
MAEALIGEVIPNPETKFFCHKCSAEIPRVLPVRGATIAANFCWGFERLAGIHREENLNCFNGPLTESLRLDRTCF